MLKMSYQAHDSIRFTVVLSKFLCKRNARPCPMFVVTRKIDNIFFGIPNGFSRLCGVIKLTIQLKRFFANAITINLMKFVENFV